MIFNFNNILSSIKFCVPHRCSVNCQKLFNIFNPTSLFLNLDYKKKIIKWHYQGCLLKRITKIMFWNLLRANTVSICYIAYFGVSLNEKWKIDDFDAQFLVWSSKIPKGVCIYYERSIFCLSKKQNNFYLSLLELHFFDSEN